MMTQGIEALTRLNVEVSTEQVVGREARIQKEAQVGTLPTGLFIATDPCAHTRIANHRKS
jgi:hypothetical protein